MSHIDDLIQRLCPNGVEFKPLSEIGGYEATRVRAETLDNNSFVGVDNLVSGKRGKTSAQYRPNTDVLTEYRPGDVLIGNIRPYLKKVWLADSSGGSSGDVLVVRLDPKFASRIDPAFLYVLLSSDHFFFHMNQTAKGAKMPRGDKHAVLRYRIPVPPLEVQREIVRVLDLFHELEAELEARRRQYVHCRNSLLTFAADVLREPLGQVADFTNGRAHERLVDPDGEVALMTSRFISTQGQSSRRLWRTDVLTPAFRDQIALVMSDLPSGRALARAFYVDADDRYAANQRVCLLQTKDRDKVLPRFLYYLVDRNPQLLSYDNGADQTHLKKDHILGIDIPILSLAEQQNVVEILDSFDTLVNDLSSGLPAELAARRKQFEHYRNKLLTFKEAV